MCVQSAGSSGETSLNPENWLQELKRRGSRSGGKLWFAVRPRRRKRSQWLPEGGGPQQWRGLDQAARGLGARADQAMAVILGVAVVVACRDDDTKQQRGCHDQGNHRRGLARLPSALFPPRHAETGYLRSAPASMMRMANVVPALWPKGSYRLTDSDILAPDSEGGATG